MRLFSRGGYGDTSLSDIAAAVGVSKSTLLHHYPSKELLLSAVLAERDRAIQDRAGGALPERASDALRDIPTGATVNALDEPGLIEVYAVLSCEAVPATRGKVMYFLLMPNPSCLVLQHAATYLIIFNGLEQCAEIALAKPFIALALDDFKK